MCIRCIGCMLCVFFVECMLFMSIGCVLAVPCFPVVSGLAGLEVCATRKPATVSVKMRNMVADMRDFICHLPPAEMQTDKSGRRSKHCDRRNQSTRDRKRSSSARLDES